MGFKKPSSIQERALPLILGGAYVARVPGACSPPVPFSRSFASRPHTPTDHRTSLVKHNRAPARRRLSAWACWASSIPTCTTRKRCVLRLLASLPFRFATSSSDWLASPISTLRSLSRKLLVRCAQTPRTHALNRERLRERERETERETHTRQPCPSPAVPDVIKSQVIIGTPGVVKALCSKKGAKPAKINLSRVRTPHSYSYSYSYCYSVSLTLIALHACRLVSLASHLCARRGRQHGGVVPAIL